MYLWVLQPKKCGKSNNTQLRLHHLKWSPDHKTLAFWVLGHDVKSLLWDCVFWGSPGCTEAMCKCVSQETLFTESVSHYRSGDRYEWRHFQMILFPSHSKSPAFTAKALNAGKHKEVLGEPSECPTQNVCKIKCFMPLSFEHTLVWPKIYHKVTRITDKWRKKCISYWKKWIISSLSLVWNK